MALRFDTDFESGQGSDFREAQPGRIRFDIPCDTESDDRQWFYFAVEGGAGRNLEFNLERTNETNMLSHWDSCRPVISSDGGKTWRRIDDSAWHHDRERCVYTFRVAIQSERDLIAYHYPYTVSDHRRKVEEWRAHRAVAHEIAGRSIDRREIDLLRIGEGDKPAKERRGIWVTARQHAGESPASFVVEAFLDFVLSEDPRARALRNHVLINVVPMINPDGVAVGNYRDNLKGINLNRVWNAADPESSPEVLGVTDSVAAWAADGNPYDMYIDFHADSYAHEHYAFRSSKALTPSKTPLGDHYYAETARYMRLIANHAPEFLGGKLVSFTEHPGIAYRYMMHQYHVIGLVPEAGYSDISHGQRAGTWLAPHDHRNVGRAFAIALQELYALPV